MYIVYKLDNINNKVKIVNHAYSDEEALKLVREEADKFTTKKSRKLFDQINKTNNEVSNGVHVTYALRESKKNVNTIDVYETRIIKKKNWAMQSTIDTKQNKIAQFSFCKYCNPTNEGDDTVLKESPNLLNNIKMTDYSSSNSTLSIYNKQLLSELKKNDMFRESQKNNNIKRRTFDSRGVEELN